jgi:hypothetical protein
MLLQSGAHAAAAADAAAGDSDGLLLPRSSVKGSVPGSMPYLSIGVPVVFHRTSFNSKFFPDCLDKKKIADRYCQVITSRKAAADATAAPPQRVQDVHAGCCMFRHGLLLRVLLASCQNDRKLIAFTPLA